MQTAVTFMSEVDVSCNCFVPSFFRKDDCTLRTNLKCKKRKAHITLSKPQSFNRLYLYFSALFTSATTCSLQLHGPGVTIEQHANEHSIVLLCYTVFVGPLQHLSHHPSPSVYMNSGHTQPGYKGRGKPHTSVAAAESGRHWLTHHVLRRVYM